MLLNDIVQMNVTPPVYVGVYVVLLVLEYIVLEIIFRMYKMYSMTREYGYRGDGSYIFMLLSYLQFTRVVCMYTFTFLVSLCAWDSQYMKIFSYFSSILFGLFWIEY